MARKVITMVITVALLSSVALYAAQKPGKKQALGKADRQQKAVQKTGQHQNLLDELAAAYKADDKEKMGTIIEKMQQRKEQRQEVAKLRRWHNREHGWQEQAKQGRGMGREAGSFRENSWASAGGGRDWQRGFRPRRMQGYGPVAGNFRPMQGRGQAQMRGWNCPAEGQWGPPPGGRMPMRNWAPRPEQGWQQGQGHGPQQRGGPRAGWQSGREPGPRQWGFEQGQDPGPDW